MKDTKAALQWIVDILECHKITYRISGGFAAQIYGVRRELADIDIEIADADILKIVADVKPHIVFGPAPYKDNNWDLRVMTLNFKGQEIDIAGANAKIFNKNMNRWEPVDTNLKRATIKEVFGRKVPVEPLDSLIDYKLKLGREVDLTDVEQLKGL